MPKEERQSARDQTKTLTGEMIHEPRPAEFPEHEVVSESAGLRSKLSVNVAHDISERLRSLAYTHRLSESSIVEVALAMFFARGDDALLGVILKQLGATLRRR
jgi:hypothetical protein